MKLNQRSAFAAALLLGLPLAANAQSAFTSSTLNYNAQTNIPTGWHITRATNCGWFAVGNDQLFFILPTGGSGAQAIVAGNDLFVSAGISPACSHAGVVAWHVIDSNTGAFDQIYAPGP